jgi:DNA invertase Pin-like site-specific DNA recombinase
MTPATVRRLTFAGKQVREATRVRDNLIRDMRSEGCSLRQIAAAAGLSHTAVAKILAKPAAGWHPESPSTTEP